MGEEIRLVAEQFPKPQGMNAANSPVSHKWGQGTIQLKLLLDGGPEIRSDTKDPAQPSPVSKQVSKLLVPSCSHSPPTLALPEEFLDKRGFHSVMSLVFTELPRAITGAGTGRGGGRPEASRK